MKRASAARRNRYAPLRDGARAVPREAEVDLAACSQWQRTAYPDSNPFAAQGSAMWMTALSHAQHDRHSSQLSMK
jgi:hypothetical protein